jgi:hypothetical protein
VLLRSIKTFIKDPEPVSSFDQVEPGLNIVEGIVRIDEPLRSPVRGQNCAAFFYRSFLVISGGRQPAFHKIKSAEVYASFKLDMEGGVLDVVPAKPGRFESGDHEALRRRYGKDFQGVEEVVLPGARVRVRGKAKKIRDGALRLTLKDIAVLDKQAVSAGVVGDRKRRRKKKR